MIAKPLLVHQKLFCRFSTYYITHHHRHYSSQRNDPTPGTDSAMEKAQKTSFEYVTITSPGSTNSAINAAINGNGVIVRRGGWVDLFKNKLYTAQSFYDEFSGMDEVKTAQNKVIEIQDQLQLVQERRRHILLELTMIRRQLHDLHVELQKVSRGEHRYVELIKDEFAILAQEREKNRIFQLVDQEERELFTHLTAAVKTSHEKERTQANNVKYWSIIGSCIGALLGIIATSVNYYRRNHEYDELKRTVTYGNDVLANVKENLREITTSLESIRNIKVSPSPQQEGWGSYLKRHTVRAYRYFVPKSN